MEVVVFVVAVAALEEEGVADWVVAPVLSPIADDDESLSEWVEEAAEEGRLACCSNWWTGAEEDGREEGDASFTEFAEVEGAPGWAVLAGDGIWVRKRDRDRE